MKLFIGDDVPNSKVKSAADLTSIAHRKLKTWFIRLPARTLPWHVNLIGELRKFNPDVILCEGESHFLGYLQAIIYKHLFNRRVGLIHWCFISLPGEPEGGKGVRSWIKAFFRQFFDAFLVYSSFSREILLRLGQAPERVFAATNVCDTEKFISLSDGLKESTAEARARLGLPDRFTILYSGTMDANKRPDVVLELAAMSELASFNFVLVGTGPMLPLLRDRATQQRLCNVFLPGRVTNELSMYYRAADVLVMPGRGGIVISEAMAFGLPTIVHQADGTESDLVDHQVTGIRLTSGRASDFANAIRQLAAAPQLQQRMSTECRRRVRNVFTTDRMVRTIVRAAQYIMASQLPSAAPAAECERLLLTPSDEMLNSE